MKNERYNNICNSEVARCGHGYIYICKCTKVKYVHHVDHLVSPYLHMDRGAAATYATLLSSNLQFPTTHRNSDAKTEFS